MNKMTINFAKLAKRFMIISLVAMFVALGSIAIRGLNFGIDFKGGTIVTIELNKQFETSEVKKITDKYDESAAISVAGDDKTQVVISTSNDLSDNQRKAIFNDFKKEYKLDNSDLLSIDKVAGSIGVEFRSMAVKACIIAVICMLIYITFRFEFIQGLCAIAALIFDMTMVIGVFSLFQIEVNSSFIAAVLTILGYSINDTIVTFDRVRENSKKVIPGDYYRLINMSINQTLARSINTTVTTLVAIIPLLIFGTSAIKAFVFPMAVGFLSGVYSSVFLAVPLWYLVKEWQKSKNPDAITMPSVKVVEDIDDTYGANEVEEEKSEEEIQQELEEKRAKRKARKEKKKNRKKGQR